MDETTKTCPRCGDDKPLTEFSTRKATSRGYGYCRPCAAAYQAARSEQNRARRLERVYGLTLYEYNDMLVAQGGVCAICGNPPAKTRLHVDHHHVRGWKKMPPAERRGFVRGLLCFRCNTQVLRRGVTPKLLRAAADYIERWEATL